MNGAEGLIRDHTGRDGGVVAYALLPVGRSDATESRPILMRRHDGRIQLKSDR